MHENVGPCGQTFLQLHYSTAKRPNKGMHAVLNHPEAAHSTFFHQVRRRSVVKPNCFMTCSHGEGKGGERSFPLVEVSQHSKYNFKTSGHAAQIMQIKWRTFGLHISLHRCRPVLQLRGWFDSLTVAFCVTFSPHRLMSRTWMQLGESFGSSSVVCSMYSFLGACSRLGPTTNLIFPGFFSA